MEAEPKRDCRRNQICKNITKSCCSDKREHPRVFVELSAGTRCTESLLKQALCTYKRKLSYQGLEKKRKRGKVGDGRELKEVESGGGGGGWGVKTSTMAPISQTFFYFSHALSNIPAELVSLPGVDKEVPRGACR